jgi:hypothetical protein
VEKGNTKQKQKKNGKEQEADVNNQQIPKASQL